MFDISPNMILFVVLALVVGALAFFLLSNPSFVDGFKKGMHEARINSLLRKQHKLTVLRQKIKAKAKKIQDKREALER